jgi:cation diffusion facilitator CzcD-associated flavoprotein CzcO
MRLRHNQWMLETNVLVIGAGLSGIGAAIRLQQAGTTDLVVLEKADDLGGTWRDNTYPGCACDVPSALYSYSFAPKPTWTRAFARQAEIRGYLHDVADRFEVRDKIRFGVEVQRAQWHETSQRWHVDTNRGSWSARAIVAAAGPWHEPLVPELPGLAGFQGEVFHSSRWRHDVDLTGRRVAVVGTGASAVQFVPEIAKRVDRLHLYQRTAQWVLPKPDGPIPPPIQRALTIVPGANAALRASQYAAMEALGVGFRHPQLLRLVQQLGVAHLRATVRDRDLRRALTPDYTLGCKRLLMSNSYYPALTRSHVSVHPCALSEIRGNLVVGADGSQAQADVIILGTGFRLLDMPIAERLHDGDGRSLAEHWKGSPQAYRGTSVAGFPNLFLILGPSLGTGHSSAFAISEAQIDHAVGAITHLANVGSLSVRPDIQDEFNQQVQQALPGTVYNAGHCNSYYFDANGRNSFAWPWTTSRLKREVSHFDADDYLIS